MAAEQRKTTLQNELNQEKSFAFGLNDSAVRYLILEREADTNRELYNAVLKRIKDLTVVADVHASNISLVDPAEPPGGPSSPNRNRDVMTALVLGLAAGLGMAFLMDLLDNTLKDSQEVERYLRLPNLALIPEAPKARASLYPSDDASAPGVDQWRRQGPGRGQLHRTLFRARRGLSQFTHRADALARRIASANHANNQRTARRGQDHGGGQYRNRIGPRARPGVVD